MGDNQQRKTGIFWALGHWTEGPFEKIMSAH
jgi:hypothetical protein